MALSTTQIQNAYVAFFNRPADVAGLTYWGNYAGSAGDLLNTFAQSAEYNALYKGMNNTQLVNAVYQNLFGRSPDVDGLNYWVSQLDSGKVTIGNAANTIQTAAQGTDKSIIDNKVAAATAFTTALDTTAEIVGYAGASSATLAQVKAWLSTVTDTSASLEAAKTGLTALTGTLAGGTNEAGATYVLTTDQDVLTGTNSGDFFRAVAGVDVNKQDQTTLNSSDIIDGGAGADTLIVNMTGPSYNGGARIKAVETLQIGTNQTTGFGLNTASATFDYNVNAGSNEVTEVTTIVYDQINGTANGAEEVLAVNNILKTGDNLPRLHWKNEAGSTAGEIQANYRSSAVAGDTKQAITLENVTAPVIDTTKGNMTIAAGVETFAITSSGSGTNTLNNATGNTPLNGTAVDLVSGNSNTHLTKVIVDGAAGFGKKATVVTLNTDNDYGLTNRALGNDLGVDNASADTTGVVRGAASNLVSVATSVTEYDASAATGAQAMRFTARTDGVATNVTFKGGAAADYAEFELGNVNATGGAGDDTFAFINTTANSSFGEGDTLVGGDGADTLQIGVNGNTQTYNISETELRNKTSFGTIDLRGSTTNLTLSSDFVAAADTANSIVVRTDKIIQTSDSDSANSSTVLTNNGQENASTHTVNLTKLSSGQSVSFLGGSGSDRIILSDATFNVLKTLDGGVYNDSTLRAAGSDRYDTITVTTNGENVVIDGQDLSNIKNFEGFVLTKNANAATYNITLTQTFLTNNTQSADNTNTAILDQVFRLGTSNAANNRALAAGDTVTINVADLLNAANSGVASGWSTDRKFDITSLENAGVTVNFVGNASGAAVTAAGLRGLGIVIANGGDANTTDVTTKSAANPGAASLSFQGTAADEFYTLQAVSDNVDMGAGTDTVTVPTAVLAPTGSINGGAGVADVLVLANNANLSGATVTGFEVLNLAATSTFGANSLLNQFTTVKGVATAAETINITAGTHTITGLDATVGEAGGNTVTYAVSAGASLQVAGNAGAASTGTAADAVFTGAGTVVTSAALTLTGASDTIAKVQFAGGVTVTDDGAVDRTFIGDANVNTVTWTEAAGKFTFNNFSGASDIINLDGAGTVTVLPSIVTTGATIVSGAAGAAKSAVILSGATFQINGALTQTGDAGEVEAKIIAAALVDAGQVASEFLYVALDNGTDTGIYRVTEAASAGTASVLDVAADFSVTLVGTLTGVSDAGVLAVGSII